MSIKNMSAMGRQKNNRTAIVPPLRFPAFRAAGEWVTPTLGEISVPVDERVGDRKLIPVSISAGIGFVPQAEKFGRDISGNQYRLYTVVRDGDFVYNKGNSLKFPQGCVYDLQGWGEVAAPNVFICFRLKDGYENRFFRQCFEQNAHGQQLRKHITSGARSNGLLNISKEAFFGVRIPAPLQAEQQRIADCLSSLDDLIVVETQTLDALKTHRRGLMQQLFPRRGEAAPRLRFPEFRKLGAWKFKTLSDIATIRSGSTPSRAEPAFYGGGTIPWVKTTDLNNDFIFHTEECITPAAKAKINPIGSVLVAMYGGFKQIGRTGYLTMPAATNQALSVLNADENEILPIYLLTWMNASVDDWKKIASSSRKDPNITGTDVANFPIAYPSKEEQRRIADVFASLNDGITARSRKIESLKAHKTGLMQQLFPTLDAGLA
jgi:type I restriction enzyme S subunit